jgi:hypothetical protein
MQIITVSMQVYTCGAPAYQNRNEVPILWRRLRMTYVNTESHLPQPKRTTFWTGSISSQSSESKAITATR